MKIWSAAKPATEKKAANSGGRSSSSTKKKPTATATAAAGKAKAKAKAKAKPTKRKRRRGDGSDDDDDDADMTFGDLTVKIRPVGTVTRRVQTVCDLDVAIDVIERAAREYALGVDSRTTRRAMTDFVREVESIVMDTVEMLVEQRILDKGVRGAEAKKRRLRKELLEVQQERLDVTARLQAARAEFTMDETSRNDAEEAHALLCEIDNCNAAAASGGGGGRGGKKTSATGKAAGGSKVERAAAQLPGLWNRIEACLRAGPHLRRANDLLEVYLEKSSA
jgi:hypothetical protein